MRTLGSLDRLIALIPPLKTVAKIPPLTAGQLLVFVNCLLLLLGFHKLFFYFPCYPQQKILVTLVLQQGRNSFIGIMITFPRSSSIGMKCHFTGKMRQLVLTLYIILIRKSFNKGGKLCLEVLVPPTPALD